MRPRLLPFLITALTLSAHAEEPPFCSLLLKPAFSEWKDADLVAQSGQNLKYLLAIPYEYTDLHVNNRIVIRGLPKHGAEARYETRILSTSEAKDLVFRHYTTPEWLPKIRERKRLVAGPVAYVSSPYLYSDITGIFLTTKDFKQEAIGLDSKIHSVAVDFHIPEGTAVLQLEPGIFVVPGTGPSPAWLVESAKQMKASAADMHRLTSIGYTPMEIPILIQP